MIFDVFALLYSHFVYVLSDKILEIHMYHSHEDKKILTTNKHSLYLQILHGQKNMLTASLFSPLEKISIPTKNYINISCHPCTFAKKKKSFIYIFLRWVKWFWFIKNVFLNIRNSDIEVKLLIRDVEVGSDNMVDKEIT